MWPFARKKSIKESGLLAGGCDYHSHLLPAVDDGIESIAEAVETLAEYEKAGIAELWLTPHIMEDYPNGREKLQQRLEELQAAYSGTIALHLAAEYMLDESFDSLLRTKDFLPIGETKNHLLVETSYFTPPMNLNSTLQRIQSAGYHPLLAHPERYAYMGKERYEELHEKGIRFQLNIMSLAGAYGREAQKKAEWLIAHDLYTVAGSDLHSPDALQLIAATPLGKKESTALRNLLKNKL